MRLTKGSESFSAIVLPVRAIDTVYRNTMGKPMYVSVVLVTQADDYAIAYAGVDDPPVMMISALPSSLSNQGIALMVPPSWYYRITTGLGHPTITEWSECY